MTCLRPAFTGFYEEYDATTARGRISTASVPVGLAGGQGDGASRTDSKRGGHCDPALD